MNIPKHLLDLAAEGEAHLRHRFTIIDRVAFENTARVMAAFARHRVSEDMFAGPGGYGYGDRGREAIDAVYADVFNAESALVRHNMINGTHALTVALFGLLRPGDVMLSVTGKPYDTLLGVIGISGKPGCGSLRDFGVEYRETDLRGGRFDFERIAAAISETGSHLRVIYVQKSRGYSQRPAITAGMIGELVNFAKKLSGAYIVVDNCYGEFTETAEPTAYGADLIVGSLIKNPGGGMAETGGYIAGKSHAVELCAYRLNVPGIGAEAGATLGQNKNILRGFFYAPHTTAQAIKTACLAAYIFDKLGYDVSPGCDEPRTDIIQSINFGDPNRLAAFCRGIQAGSPVDAHVTPEAWEMPGYGDKIIMAAGTFVQGASIELSADGPMREPYTAYIQGGLTYESGKYGILTAAAVVAD